jgi:uncharacterized glyoxalase superfamily protein PhnB
VQPIRISRVGSLAERTAQLAIELRVSNLPNSIAFYQEAGLVLERRTPTFAAMQIDGRYLLLSESGPVEVGATRPNIRILVADVDRSLSHAQKLGWTIKHALADRGYGLRDFVVDDPDGYEVRFAALSEG